MSKKHNFFKNLFTSIKNKEILDNNKSNNSASLGHVCGTITDGTLIPSYIPIPNTNKILSIDKSQVVPHNDPNQLIWSMNLASAYYTGGNSTKSTWIKITYQIIKNYKSINDCHELIATIKSVPDLCNHIETINIQKNKDDDFNFILNYKADTDDDLKNIYERLLLILNLKSL